MDSYHVTHVGNGWELKQAGTPTVLKRTTTKEDMLRQLAGFFGERKASVRIHLENGRIEEERTYPRSADPRTSQG